jgi:hypothetical protein
LLLSRQLQLAPLQLCQFQVGKEYVLLFNNRRFVSRTSDFAEVSDKFSRFFEHFQLAMRQEVFVVGNSSRLRDS